MLTGQFQAKMLPVGWIFPGNLVRCTLGQLQRSTVLPYGRCETFHAARKIAPHAGIVKSVLRLFDELAKCDPEGLLEGVREAVEEVA